MQQLIKKVVNKPQKAGLWQTDQILRRSQKAGQRQANRSMSRLQKTDWQQEDQMKEDKSIRHELQQAEQHVVIVKNMISTDLYLELRDSVGWKKLSREQAHRALKNSLCTMCAIYDGKPVGMGRIVGDGSVICYVQDLIVRPDVQHLGVGSILLNALTEYVESITLDGTEMMFDLMCAKGRETFYEKHGFIARPTDSLGPGMIRYIKK